MHNQQVKSQIREATPEDIAALNELLENTPTLPLLVNFRLFYDTFVSTTGSSAECHSSFCQLNRLLERLNGIRLGN